MPLIHTNAPCTYGEGCTVGPMADLTQTKFVDKFPMISVEEFIKENKRRLNKDQIKTLKYMSKTFVGFEFKRTEVVVSEIVNSAVVTFGCTLNDVEIKVTLTL